MAYYILFSAKNRIYKQNTHAHYIHNVELKTLHFNFVWLLQNRFRRSISRKWKKKTLKLHNRPYITRLVICVSRAFCSTNEERRETARSLVINVSYCCWRKTRPYGTGFLFFVLSTHLILLTQFSKTWRTVNFRAVFSSISRRRLILLTFRGTQRQFLENICSEDDLRSRIFGTL